ncbi:hypothetical protein NUW58_g7671 [Xylaria curta]|uniref:Uncharacterized protein n=1 Tax=Xylaria curta TaxID=42375 RepID=A0ACC1NG59_9PEZI|nr:hypothetical protein NUW58_g7671 [Xylaria curta]
MGSDLGHADQYPVYLGVWTNWSRGRVLGLTLTIGRQEANLLIAFTAFFIAFVATRFWRVVCFAFHRLYATATSQNAIYHQRQAILRNSSTAEGAIQQLFELMWANRHRSDRFAPLLMALIALLCTTVFTAAGGLSSQISTAVGTEVLIRSLNCGISNRHFYDLQDYFALVSFQSEFIDNAANYAQQCYSSNASGNLDCGRFVIQNLTSIIDDDASCPFGDDICRSSSKNLRIDTGYIDSREHFGLNSPDRFFARSVLHCAPIKTKGYTSLRSTSMGNFTLYHYGSTLAPSGRQNFAFAAESIESQYAFAFSPDYPTSGGNYGVSALRYNVANKTVVNSEAQFIPINSLFRDDADITLVFLSGNGVFHSAPSTDEWYRVSPIAVNVSASLNAAVTPFPIYLPEEPASPLGCASQYQFCHGDLQHCGALASMADARSSVASLFHTTAAAYDDSNSTSQDPFRYFVAGFAPTQSASIPAMLSQLGSASLASKSSITSLLQGPLPSNQWQLDVIRWSDITKASLQAAYLGISYSNPPDGSRLQYRMNFTSQAFETLCNNQKIRSTAYTSFSVFGLLFTFIIGLLIAMISYLLEPISRMLYKKWGYQTFAYLEWNTNTTLQLQRLAHEQLGFGTWSKGADEIPITEAGNLLGCLDISNPDHPVLSPPDKYRIPLEENQSDHETLEDVTSFALVSDGRASSVGSVYTDSSASNVAEQASRLPTIPRTAGFTIGTADEV